MPRLCSMLRIGGTGYTEAMRWVLWLGVCLWPCLAHGAVSAADVAREVREMSLDPGECYRVRDVALPKDEARFFFTDGYLIFAKPVAGVRMSAVFTADVEGGDAEVLVFPPNRGERRARVGRFYRGRGGRRCGSVGLSAQSRRAAVAGILHGRAEPGRAPGGHGADLLRRYLCEADRTDPPERRQQEKPRNGRHDGRALGAGGAQHRGELSSAAGVGCAPGRTAKPRFFGRIHEREEAGQLRPVLRP